MPVLFSGTWDHLKRKWPDFLRNAAWFMAVFRKSLRQTGSQPLRMKMGRGWGESWLPAEMFLPSPPMRHDRK
jgi:hypothetical protein